MGRLRSHQRHRPCCVAVLATIFFCVGQAGGPARAEYAGMNYYIERPRLAAELSYRMETDEVQGPFASTSNSTQQFRQRIDIETGGFVYHPALMTYSLTLSPEWQQEFDDYDPGTEQTSDTFLLGYSVDMTFLESKPYSLDVFARQQRSTLTTSLATTSESVNDAYGATLRLKYPVLPTTLALAHSTTDQSGFFDSYEVRDEARLNMRHTRPSNDTNFNAIWVELDRTALGSTINTENLFGILQNFWRITPDNRVLLNSSLTLRDSKSDIFSSSGVDLSENLSWRHSDTFSTYYDFLIGQDKTELRTIDRLSASAGLSHSLYENLITTAFLSANTSSIGEDDYGGNVNFNYQRRIPGGTVYASLGQDYRITTRSYEVALIQVVNEEHVLTTGAVVTLNNRNVVLSTVVVTSPDGLIIYTRDIPGVQLGDYRLEEVGTSVIITRTSYGAIPDGGTVLVSYQYLSNPAYDSSNYEQSYGLGFYLWSAWRINYRYSHSQEEFISGIPPDVLAEDIRHTLDSDLTWRWSTTRFLYEDIESTTGVSSTRWRLEESLLFRPLENTFLNLSAYIGHTTLKDLNSDDDFYGFRGNVQWRVNNWSKAKIEGFYDEIDGTSNNTITMGAEARWDWYYGIWAGEAVYRVLNGDDRLSDQTRDRQSIFFSIRRSLF